MDLIIDSQSSDSSSAHSSPQQAQSTLPEVLEIGDLHGDVMSRNVSSDTSESSEQCMHFMELLSEHGEPERCSAKYKAMVTWAAKSQVAAISSNPNSRPVKKRKVQCAECDSCGVPLHRPFVCLSGSCNFAGCWKDGHAILHLRNEGHRFCVDVKSGSIYCSSCDDFIHNPSFEAIHSSAFLQRSERNTKFQESKTKKTRLPFVPWKPTAEETAMIQQSKKISCQGRRGLMNLGATCYLNVILQTFFHNPLLRNYFLSDMHAMDCKNTDKNIEKIPCISCEMDKLFSEFYSENASPYGPISFLRTMWMSSTEMAGYQQQDAHEFLIALLNQIHATSRVSTAISCVCIVHSTFAGSLQSDVKCGKCGSTVSTVDPVLDISLELRPEKMNEDVTLASCLRRFTQPEKLAIKSYKCEKCATTSSEATKQMSFKKLPPVLCFQFKRYEHNATAQKINTSLRFPATLNMSPYTSLSVSAKGDRPLGPSILYDYDLIAVVNHEGQMNTGHYTNFAKFRNDWYRFDDEKVTTATLSECLSSVAYMCVYVKRQLDYKPYVKPSYVVTQQQAAEKERQEKERQDKESSK